MPSIFTITNDQHGQELSQVFSTWIQEKDVCLISSDSHYIWTSFNILNIFSPFLRKIFSVDSIKNIGISVPADLETIESALDILKNEDLKDATYSQDVLDCLVNLGIRDIAACLELKGKQQNCEDTSENDILSEKANNGNMGEVLTEDTQKRDICMAITNPVTDDTTNIEVKSPDAFKVEASEIEQSEDNFCTICESNYATKASLKKHQQRKHESKVYYCESCDYTSSLPEKLKIHQSAKHEGLKYPCDMCDFVCSYKSYLKVHIENKHEGIKYPCSYCDYKSTDKVYIRKHILSQHEGFTIPCPVEDCQYLAKSRSYLTEHTWRKHEEPVYIFCEECPYKTVKKSSLKHHILVDHKGVRFECDSCDYKARSKLNLKTHKESVHDKIKHPCDTCGYMASTKNFLYVHKQSKHGEARYYCDQCKYVSTSLVYLRQHKKRSCT